MKFASAAAAASAGGGADTSPKFLQAILGNNPTPSNGRRRLEARDPSSRWPFLADNTNTPERAGRRIGPSFRALAEAGREAALRNLVASGGDSLQECDPQEEQDWGAGAGADVGVLSCGPGRYCLETHLAATALGGICVPDSISSSSSSSRQLQPGDGTLPNMTAPPSVPTNVLERVYDACYGSMNFTQLYPEFTCECSGVDLELYTGYLQCNTNGFCIDEQTFLCNVTETFGDDTTFTYEITAPRTFTYARCVNYTEPIVVSACSVNTYTGDPYLSSCSMQINGTTCSACGLADCDYTGGGNVTTCIAFDCTNTDYPIEGYFFPYSSLGFFIKLSLLANDTLPCEGGCNLCGDNGVYMTNQGNVTIDGYGDIPCYYIEYLAWIGQVPPDRCGPLGEAVFSECACAPPEGETMGPQDSATPSPAGAGPTEGPSMAAPEGETPGPQDSATPSPAGTTTPEDGPSTAAPVAAPSGSASAAAAVQAAGTVGGLVAAATAVAVAAAAGLG
jgi:hypothetical protein